jgi:hypothetical protein
MVRIDAAAGIGLQHRGVGLLDLQEKGTAHNDIIVKQGFKAQVAAAKDELARSIEQHWKPAGNGAVRLALLELAIERQFEICGGEHAFEVIEGVFKRMVKQRTH